jgi:signal peptidase
MKYLLRIIVIYFVIFVSLVLFVLSNQIGGWKAFIVSSGSMEPTIPTGSLVVTRYTHPSTLHVNDIITFIAPTREKPTVTHRIVRVIKKETLTTFKTKGDNNKAEDTWRIAGGGVLGKVVMTIPVLGYFFSFIQTKWGILLFILFPAVYIILDEVTTIIKVVKNARDA